MPSPDPARTSSVPRLRSVLIGVAALGLVAVGIPSLASASPFASPKPNPGSITSVQKQLGALALQNTQLIEKFDQAQIAVTASQKLATAAQQAANQARAAYSGAQAELGATVTAQYEGGGSFSAAGALMSSESGQSYLDQLDALSMVSDHTAQLVKTLQTAKAKAVLAQTQANTVLKAATAKRDALAKQRATVTAQVQKYTNLLGKLTAAKRAAYLAAANPPVSKARVAAVKTTLTVVHANSAAAAVAIKFALNQVGKPYSWGSAGPGSYDCSGLTMRAWGAAGVSLPHSAAQQYGYGHHVSLDALQPGDLIFFYQPIGHVTIYIGNGLMVSAPETGENVSVVPLNAFHGQITGATRLT